MPNTSGNKSGNKKDLTIKQEQFCRAIIKEPNATKAYKEVYPQSSEDSANANASRMLAKDSVRNRVKELMREQGLSEPSLLSRLNYWKENNDYPAVSLDATKTGLKIMGFFDDDDSANSNKELRIEIAIVPNKETSSITIEQPLSN